MARVTRRGGHLALIDMISGGVRHDELERRRDPSHTRALTEAELDVLLRDAGARPVTRSERSARLPVDAWLAGAAPAPDEASAVRRALAEEADGEGGPTGLHAHRGPDGALQIAQRWLMLVARRA